MARISCAAARSSSRFRRGPRRSLVGSIRPPVQAKFELRIKMYYDYMLGAEFTVTLVTQPCDAGAVYAADCSHVDWWFAGWQAGGVR